VVAAFLQSNQFERHLRKLRTVLRHQREKMAEAIAHYFPEGTRLCIPDGGVSIWVEMPPQVSSRAVFDAALKQDILVSPGLLYSNSNRFDHYLRLNCGATYSRQIDDAVCTLGQIVQQQAALKQQAA